MATVGKRAFDVYRVVIALVALACVAQIYLAGRGVFGMHGNAAIGDQSSFDAHRALGSVIGVATVVAFVLALVLWDMKLVVWTLVLAVLATAVQTLSTHAGNSWVAGFHALGGLAVFAISGALAHRAWRPRGTAEPVA